MLADLQTFEALDGWFSTSSYAAELGLIGVRERALAVGQAARKDSKALGR